MIRTTCKVKGRPQGIPPAPRGQIRVHMARREPRVRHATLPVPFPSRLVAVVSLIHLALDQANKVLLVRSSQYRILLGVVLINQLIFYTGSSSTNQPANDLLLPRSGLEDKGRRGLPREKEHLTIRAANCLTRSAPATCSSSPSLQRFRLIIKSDQNVHDHLSFWAAFINCPPHMNSTS